jgi:hypothetical protein
MWWSLVIGHLPLVICPRSSAQPTPALKCVSPSQKAATDDPSGSQ